GLTGLSMAWLFVPPFIVLPLVMRSAPALGLRVKDVFAAMGPAMGAASVMYGAVAAARHGLEVWDGLQGAILRLAAVATTGAVVYCVASFVLNRRGTMEVWELIHSLARPNRG